MSSTKFAGLGDVKRPGLSVLAATQRLLCLSYVEKRLMFSCAAKMISVPERDLKLLLGRLQHQAAGRSHSLRHRLREMRTAKVRIDGVPSEALAILLDEALFGDDSSEVARFVWWIHRELLASYEAYLATTNPLADAPTCELIESFLLSLRATVASLYAYLDQVGVPEPERNLPPRLQKFADAAGGVDGCKTKAERASRERSTEPFAIPRKPGRDAGLKQVWDYVKPPMEHVADYFAYMLGIRLSEINVAEGLAVVLCETKEMPWEFYWDISRHLWDEVRHSMMGEAGIEATFGATSAIPMREYESVYCMEAPALEQYATLGLEIEGAQMKYPVGKRGEWEFCRDAVKHPLMTTFQDFDWADEVLHVGIAKRQLSEWFRNGANELNSLAEQGKQNRAKVKERQAPVNINPGDMQRQEN
jgi:hypothetical protein